MKPRRRGHNGFTLLEVILALAILGLALATLGQAVGRSHENARKAADETELALIAQSVLDELLAGVRQFAAFDGEGVADPRDPTGPAIAIVSASITGGPYDGLVTVRVQARPNSPTAKPLDTVELVQWMVDPSLEEEASESGAAL